MKSFTLGMGFIKKFWKKPQKIKCLIKLIWQANNKHQITYFTECRRTKTLEDFWKRVIVWFDIQKSIDRNVLNICLHNIVEFWHFRLYYSIITFLFLIKFMFGFYREFWKTFMYEMTSFCRFYRIRSKR